MIASTSSKALTKIIQKGYKLTCHDLSEVSLVWPVRCQVLAKLRVQELNSWPKTLLLRIFADFVLFTWLKAFLFDCVSVGAALVEQPHLTHLVAGGGVQGQDQVWQSNIGNI